MAYAAVISLKHNIKHPINNLSIDPKITKSLLDKLSYLEGLLQAFDVKSDQRFDAAAIKALDADIRTAVWKLEDAFESYALLHHSNNDCQQMPIPVEQEIHSFIQTVQISGSEFNTLLHHPLDGDHGDGEEDEDEDEDFGGNKLQSTTIPIPSPVDKLKEIAWELIDTHHGIKVVTLVGMAGIGKSHFARQVLQHRYIVETYDFTAWVRVGQRGRVKDIVAEILAQIERKPTNIYLKKNMYTIALLLRKNLAAKKCLVVLDDIWSDEVCHDVIGRLADAGVNRVLLTTRLRHINKYELSKIYEMWFLDNEESWSLLWKNVFPGKSSFPPPPHLEKVGRKIAANCEGLPLLILVVAQLLRGLDMTEEYWEKVADRKTTTFVDAYEKIAKVLFSSYHYLPEHLKACFLYMGVFPQTCEIPIFKLIALLVAEDFLEPNGSDQTLDDFGIECVKKLVSNSLVIIRKQSYDCMIKSCKLHSAYWYLCVKEARKNKFLHVLNKLTDGSQECIQSQRRLSVQNSILFGIKEVYDSMADASTARSLLCTGEDHEYPVPICLNLVLLRVLDAASIRLYEFPEEVVGLLLLRYLSLTHNGKLPRSVSNLKRLQCLIIRQHHNIKLLSDSHPAFLPAQIWDMQQLKHLRIMGHNLPDPSYGAELASLVTLHVNAHSCSEAVFRSLPNLKKLGIEIELQPHVDEALTCFEHIGLLDGLESFKCVVVNPRLRCQGVPPPHHLSNLPRGLKKVSLSGLGYGWEYMTAISSLPDLKVLKLRCSAFQGAEWKIENQEFRSLEFLLLEDIDLVQCTLGEYKCFRNLQRLTMQHCFMLKTMSPDIGVLRRFTVEVVDCSPSLVAYAKEMEESKIDPLIVVNSSWTL